MFVSVRELSYRFRSLCRRFCRRSDAASLGEYALLLGVVAAALVVVLTQFKGAIGNGFTRATTTLGSAEGSAVPAGAGAGTMPGTPGGPSGNTGDGSGGAPSGPGNSQGNGNSGGSNAGGNGGGSNNGSGGNPRKP